MALPKEPRQLMINIMYLVLTAMLALNVSAEIFNAFKLVDKSLDASNEILDKSNAQLPAQIKKLAQKKEEFAVYGERATEVTKLADEFCDYVTGITDHMIDETGDKNGKNDEGDYAMIHDHPVLIGKKNKDITTRYLVEGGKGDELEAKINEYRQKFLALIDEDERTAFEEKVTLKVSDDWTHSDKKSWAAYNFYQMPMAATLPIFNKMKNDAKSTASAILANYMEKVGGEDIVLDKFQVVSSPKKTYVIQGEKFETEVFLSASASESSNTGVAIKVNGSSVDSKDGVATFTQTAGSPGVKKYKAEITTTNPVTGEVNTYENEFEYEVGLRSVSVAATKMNVFYIGVENPVSVSAAGVSSSSLKVSASGGGLKLSKKGGNYVANVTTPGEAKITVSGDGLKATSFPFRVKRIPDPQARLGKKPGGPMGTGEFKAQGGVLAMLDNFDFDAKCTISGFEMVYVPKRQDPVPVKNAGPRYSDKARRLVQKAKPGDIYYFDNVRAKCPGDKASRQVNSMVFKIK